MPNLQYFTYHYIKLDGRRIKILFNCIVRYGKNYIVCINSENILFDSKWNFHRTMIHYQMNIADTSQQLKAAEAKQPTYKSRIRICLMCWAIAMATFQNGYWMVYIQQINIVTLKELFGIGLNSSVATGILNGCIPIGALIGAILNPIITARFTRSIVVLLLRKSLLLVNFLALTVGGIIFTRSFVILLICRVLQGFCVGNYCLVVSPMIRQLSPKQIAGFSGSFMQINHCLGATSGYLISYILQKLTDDKSGEKYWQFVFAFPLLIITMQTLILLFLFTNQTPKYWLSVGNVEQARKLIQQIYKPQFVQQILQQKINDLQSLKVKKQTETGKFTQYSKFQIIVAIHLGLLLQFSGINAVVVYGGKIVESLFIGESARLMPIIINFDQIVGLSISSILLLRIGRRRILLFGILVLVGANGLILSGFMLRQNKLTLIGLLIFMFVFGLSLGGVIWIYFSEIVQPQYMLYAVSSNWIAAACIIILFPIFNDNFLNGNPAFLFVFFTSWCILAFLFSYWFVIETKDKTEKQIKEEYDSLQFIK